MYLIIWRYRVVSENEVDFQAAYGSKGEWSEFFSSDPAFLGVELIAGSEPGLYVTVDRWESETAYERFMDEHHDSYRAVDRRMETLTEFEELVTAGVAVPDEEADRRL